MLEGIQFVTNESGEKTAVLLDLNQYGEIWEDIYNIILTRERENEPRESLEEVRKYLLQTAY